MHRRMRAAPGGTRSAMMRRPCCSTATAGMTTGRMVSIHLLRRYDAGLPDVIAREAHTPLCLGQQQRIQEACDEDSTGSAGWLGPGRAHPSLCPYDSAD